jgi:hypothetical protein
MSSVSSFLYRRTDVMDRADVEHWLDRYRHAWSTDDPKDIAALFTEEATYSPFPWPRGERNWKGRDTIIDKWIGHGDSKAGWHFEHNILAVDGNTAVIEGWTTYDPTAETPYEDAYANIWVVRFADDGRARSFAEWWVQRPVPSAT